jgi:hypothetical protein
MNAVSAAEKSAILAHYTAQAADAALMGPALGHPADPRTSPSETASSLRYVIDDALEALYRASDALDKAETPEATQRVIDKLHGIGGDLGNADWE